MYNEGFFKSYEIGKATSEEILEVLKFATSYYQLVDYSTLLQSTGFIP